MLRRQVGKLLLVLAQAWFATNVVEFGNGENNRCETKPGLPKEKKKSSHSTIASHLCKQKIQKNTIQRCETSWLFCQRHLSRQPAEPPRYGTPRCPPGCSTPHGGCTAQHSGVGSLSWMGGVVDPYGPGWVKMMSGLWPRSIASP